MENAITDVEAMIRVGVSFEHIEAYIDNADVHSAVKNVLWLLAWCETDAGQRRAAVRELIGGLPNG